MDFYPKVGSASPSLTFRIRFISPSFVSNMLTAYAKQCLIVMRSHAAQRVVVESPPTGSGTHDV